jgi:acetyl-CoA carboxylase carboxyltransferase component
MGAEGAVNILYRKQISTATDSEAERKRLEDEYRQKYLNPYAAANAGYIDEVIEPAQTRQKLIEALEVLANKVESTPARKHGNMPV